MNIDTIERCMVVSSAISDSIFHVCATKPNWTVIDATSFLLQYPATECGDFKTDHLSPDSQFDWRVKQQIFSTKQLTTVNIKFWNEELGRGLILMYVGFAHSDKNKS